MSTRVIFPISNSPTNTSCEFNCNGKPVIFSKAANLSSIATLINYFQQMLWKPFRQNCTKIFKINLSIFVPKVKKLKLWSKITKLNFKKLFRSFKKRTIKDVSSIAKRLGIVCMTRKSYSMIMRTFNNTLKVFSKS